MTAAIRRGSSWSGRERNGAFLNLGDGRYVDSAGISGFDFADDARAAASVDWDLDGRLDVWIKNRTGPQLRFLRNDTVNDHAYVALELQGTRSNRDAIGAVVELTVNGAKRVQQVSAGSGYLAQSSSTLHFGLGRATSIDRLAVVWPGGARESIEPPPVNARYRVTQDTGRARRIEAVSIVLPDHETPASSTEPATRLLLKTPLPLPPGLLENLGVPEGRTTLVNLWAHWCEPCAGEIRSYARRIKDLDDRSILWSPVSLDAPQDHDAATDWLRRQFASAGNDKPPPPRFLDDGSLRTLEVLLEHVTDRNAALPIPANLLVDARGNLQLLYFGPVFPDRFLSDEAAVLDPEALASRRSLYPGRWYYRSRRNLGELGRTLGESGRADDARFYLEKAGSE